MVVAERTKVLIVGNVNVFVETSGLGFKKFHKTEWEKEKKCEIAKARLHHSRDVELHRTHHGGYIRG